jgi:GntR family transcriptional regulator
MADPMYRQIAEDLRRQIEDGEIAPGSQLQTELELRERYNASRNTIRDAIKALITRGLVETRPGQGTFVIKKMVPFVTTLTGTPETSSGEGPTYKEEVAALFRQPSSTPPRVEIQEAGQTMPELGIGGSEQVVSRHQERSIDGTPWSLQTSFYSMSLVQDGALRLIQAGDIPEGTVAYLDQTLGIRQVGYRDTITVRAPDGFESRFFGLSEDGSISVIEIRRTAFDQHGAPVRLTISVYPADRNQFAVIVGQVPESIAAPPSAVLAEPAADGDRSSASGSSRAEATTGDRRG